MQSQHVSPFLLGVLSRLVVLLWAILMTKLGAPYDSSTLLLPRPPSSQLSIPPNFFGCMNRESCLLDASILHLLSSLSNWDGAYFIHLAGPWGGYWHEQFHAFLPGFPYMLHFLRITILSPLENFGVASPRTVLLLGGLTLNVVAFGLGAVALTGLTRRVLGPGNHVLLSTLAYCVTPGGIFFSALYTESTFCAATFWGLWALEEGIAEAGNRKSFVWSPLWRVGLGASLLVLASSIRSNGIMGVIFVAWSLFRIGSQQWLRWEKRSTKGKELNELCSFESLSLLLPHLLVFIPSLILPFLPLILFSRHARERFCSSPYTCSDLPPKDDPPWCPCGPSSLYPYVQSQYWGVGWLRRWKISQLPHFVLAFPMLILGLVALWKWWSRGPGVWKWGGSSGPLKTIFRLGQGKLDEQEGRLTPYILHWLLLCTVGIFFSHPQVLTRLCSSSNPAVYWTLAWAWSEGGNARRIILATWCVGYTVVGTALFTNAYNWT